MAAMIIGALGKRNLRFALALGACTATIPLVRLTRRHMIALSAGLLTPAAVAGQPPLVFAAASLKTVLDEISKDVPMRLNYAGSGVLARQITLGAPADLFISANAEWMDVVANAGRLESQATPFLSNRLVLVGPDPLVSFKWGDLAGSGRVAMGFTEAVPAGQYGKAAFQSLGIWGAIEAQVVQTENVRAAMALVARGELPWGVVYRTDAMADPNVHVIAEFGANTHPQITYQAGVIKGSTSAETLKAIRDHGAFAEHGFLRL